MKNILFLIKQFKIANSDAVISETKNIFSLCFSS